MAQSPNIGGRRVLSGKAGAKKEVSRSNKARRQDAGTFQMQARRESILGPRALGATERACSGCFAVYFDKHWHSPSFFGGKSVVKKASLAAGLCEACKLKAEGPRAAAFVGEIVIGGGFSPEETAEIVRIARNVGKRAQNRDPEDRILSIETQGGEVRIRTSENQLAVSIGKQVHRARKGSKLTVTWSYGDKPVRVRIEK